MGSKRVLSSSYSSFFFFFLSLVLISPSTSSADTFTSRDDFSSRIVGGEPANPGAWPFMVALLAKGPGSKFSRQFCGGSLIASKWVLTAAHCIFGENKNSMEIGIGLHDLRDPGGEVIDVQNIMQHPQYNNFTLENDIALIELKTASTQGTRITLATQNYNTDGLTSTTIGWGTTSSGGVASPILMQVDLDVVTNQKCKEAYVNSIKAGMVCAGFDEGGKDACQGDSGGPLFVGDGSSPVLIGATSFGNGCALPGFYGVYARVSEYIPWITQYVNVGQNEPEVSPVIPSEPVSETNGDYGFWNGFIGLINIAELQNNTSNNVNARINVFDINGELASSNTFIVSANQQRDVILNDLSGFKSESYGVVQISNNVSGRITYYKPKVFGGFSDFDFAYTLPFDAPLTGRTSVAFNTFQPSFDASEANNLVANWLSVVNLDASPKTFTVNKYDQSGNLISSLPISLSSRNREDVDGGHLVPGPNSVGLLEIVPSDPNAKYTAQLVRYGSRSGGAGFNFAFPLVATKGLTNTHYFSLGSRDVSQNWLEVMNPTSNPVQAQIIIYSENGAMLHNKTETIGARSQFHLNASDHISQGSIGFGKIIASGTGRIASQSMLYYQDSSTGSLASISGLQESPRKNGIINGSYNLFLSMESQLRIHNANSTPSNMQVRISSASSGGSTFNVSLAGNESKEFNLHDYSSFGTSENTYGSVRITPSSGANLVASTTRLKIGSNGLPQFVIPALLR